MTLVEFLTARLDEDEAAARAATVGPWFLDAPDHAYVGNRADGRTYGLWAIVHMSGDVLPDLTDDAQRRTLADARHIARQGPDRVLREVAAKRALVDVAGRLGTVRLSGRDEPFPPAVTFYAGRVSADDGRDRRDVTKAWQEWWDAQPKDYCDPTTLHHLAAVYSDHPDYDEAWRA